jgi:membrane-associated protease RseP (regulator of RpoE activity)
MKLRLDIAIGFVVALIALFLLSSYGIISFDLFTFLVFIAILVALILNDRKNVKLEGIIFIRRTIKGRKFINSVAHKRPVFWGRMAVIGVVIGIITLVAGTAFLVSQGYDILAGSKESGVKLLLPGPVSQPVNAPGVFVVPWWIWVVGVAAVIIPHEFFHGIMCRLDKIKIKSVGWLLLFIIPGAFVEPDEKQLQKSKRRTKLKVYAAGSFANILVALVVFAILALSFPLLFSNAGVFVKTNNTGFSVFDINGTPVHDRNDFLNALSNVQINDTIKMTIAPPSYVVPKFSGIIPEPVMTLSMQESKTINVTIMHVPESIETMQAMGFVFGAENVRYYYDITILLLWVYLFSLGVGMVNMLPIKPLDGGLLFEEITGKFTKSAKIITKIVTVVVLLILIFNLIGPVFI